jgi:hypothetical protein
MKKRIARKSSVSGRENAVGSKEARKALKLERVGKTALPGEQDIRWSVIGRQEDRLSKTGATQ